MGYVPGNGSDINQLGCVAFTVREVSVSWHIAGTRENNLLKRQLTNSPTQMRQISNIFERR